MRWLAELRARAAISIAVWAFVIAIAWVPPWRAVELKTFDWLTVLTAPGAGDDRIVLVKIDEPSFAELDLQWPWPRDIHARLVERLREAGAAVIVFDVVFAEPSTPAADERLAQAARAAGNVVLAAEEALIENAYVVQRTRVQPIPVLGAAAAASGIATFSVDADSIVRRMPGDPETLWRAVLRVAARAGVAVPPATVPAGGFIRFAGGEQPFNAVSFYQALDPATFLPPGYFRDRLVLIGLDLKTTPEPGIRQADMFVTPLVALSKRLAPGVEVQAHVLNTILREASIREVPRVQATLVAIALGALATWLLRPWRPLRSGAIAGALALGVAAAAWALFRWAGVWLPVMGLVVGLMMLYGGEGAVAYVRAQRGRRHLKQAFGHYVSPHIVKQIMRRPGRVKLGGERREVTVLFCDLAGFTTISERLSPEEVVALLTRYLTAVTTVVIASGGTVVKYLGDGMMALWGAPLADPDHARHACEAAAAMQTAMAKLNRELAGAGGQELAMRVGVHSGDAVVGNMGSRTRFDYTATGDTVNLASRLEGVNKVYGTGVLLSEATVHLAGAGTRFRRVDRVRVKGKREATEIFTLVGHPAVAEAGEEAIEAYRKRRWDDAVALWKRVLSVVPSDRVAAIYLERIAGFRTAPPPDDWDGSVTLTEK